MTGSVPSGGRLVLVLGMVDSGVEEVGRALEELGLSPIGDQLAKGGADVSRGVSGLSAFNDLLLAELGSTWDSPAMLPRLQLLSILAHRVDEARALLGVEPNEAVEVWADPRLTVLAPFWAVAMDRPVSIVAVHRDPAGVANGLVGAGRLEGDRALALWDEYNRAALSLWEEFSGLVVSMDDARSDSSSAVARLVDFVATLEVAMTEEQVEAAGALLAAAPAPAPAPAPATIEPVANRFQVLARVLGTLSGQSGVDGIAVAELFAGYYDEEYYDHYGSEAGIPYRPGEPRWTAFFAAIADRIVEELHPGSTLDIGCAIGFLVEALQNRGVEAWGIDVSQWAISQVPSSVQSQCSVATLTEELDGHFDLITIVEVIEHLPAAVADQAIGNITRHAEAVLFSSTPDGFDEATHVNVRTPDYWAGLFAGHGFYRDCDYDASYLSKDAVLFRRGAHTVESAIEAYERALWRAVNDKAGQSMLLSQALKDQTNRAEQLTEDATVLRSEADGLRSEVDGLWAEIHRLRNELGVIDRTQRAHSLESERERLALIRKAERLEVDLNLAKAKSVRRNR